MISAADSARKNLAASIDVTTGNASEAMAWMPVACCGLLLHLSIPECRMYAPVTRREATFVASSSVFFLADSQG